MINVFLNCECEKFVFNDKEILTKYSKIKNKHDAETLYWSYLLEEFRRVRSKCPALQEILIPDDIWP